MAITTTQHGNERRHHDNAGGVTRISLDAVHAIHGRIGPVHMVQGRVRKNEHGANVAEVWFYGAKGVGVFSGFAWGYGGEGPRGLAAALAQFGFGEVNTAALGPWVDEEGLHWQMKRRPDKDAGKTPWAIATAVLRQIARDQLDAAKRHDVVTVRRLDAIHDVVTGHMGGDTAHAAAFNAKHADRQPGEIRRRVHITACSGCGQSVDARNASNDVDGWLCAECADVADAHAETARECPQDATAFLPHPTDPQHD